MACQRAARLTVPVRWRFRFGRSRRRTFHAIQSDGLRLREANVYLRASRFFMVLAATFALAGCAGKPTGVLTPTAASAPGATKVELLVATTRASQGAAVGEMFSGERARGLAFADIAVSVPPRREVGEVQWPDALPGNPATDFVTLRADRLDGDAAVKLFSAKLAAAPRRNVLLFVHGYNTRFEEAVYRFAQIIHDSGADAAPVLFTWPSRGKLLAYNYDRESANYSRDALEAVLQAMAKHPRVGEISILAHSMGNWVTLEALRQMAIRDKAIHPKIRNVMLAAPDVDFDVFRRQIAAMGEKRPAFTLFVSQDDDALKISSRVSGGEARLGMIDPKAEPYRAELEKALLASPLVSGDEAVLNSDAVTNVIRTWSGDFMPAPSEAPSDSRATTPRKPNRPPPTA